MKTRLFSVIAILATSALILHKRPADVRLDGLREVGIPSHARVANPPPPIENVHEAVRLVLNPKNLEDQRRGELYAMTLAGGPKAVAALAEIASHPLPEVPGSETFRSAGYARLKFERALRMTALEALDRMAVQGLAVRKQLQHILKVQRDPTLSFLAQTTLTGVEEGHPGSLEHLIERFRNR
jgi:hypothetical protein